jgi:hypothetical protein
LLILFIIVGIMIQFLVIYSGIIIYMHPYLEFLQHFNIWLEFQEHNEIIWPEHLSCDNYLAQLTQDIYRVIENKSYYDSLIQKNYSKPNLIAQLPFLMSFIRPIALSLEQYQLLAHLVWGNPDEQLPALQSNYLFMLPLWNHNPAQFAIIEYLIDSTAHFEIAYFISFAKKIPLLSLSFEQKIRLYNKIAKGLYSFNNSQERTHIDNPQFLYAMHLAFAMPEQYQQALDIFEQTNNYYFTSILDSGRFTDDAHTQWHIEISQTQFHANYYWFVQDFSFSLIITHITTFLQQPDNLKRLNLGSIEYSIETDVCHLIFHSSLSSANTLCAEQTTELFYFLVKNLVYSNKPDTATYCLEQDNYHFLNASILKKSFLQFILDKDLMSDSLKDDTIDFIKI